MKRGSKKELILKIFKEMYGESTGHDFYHVIRVLNNAKKIYLAESKKTKMNWEIIELSCLLHDIADHKFFKGTEQEAKEMVLKIMNRIKTDEKVMEKVIHIISNMSFKGGKNESIDLGVEGKVVRDADRLDALGAVGIARAFATGAFFKRPIYNPLDKISKQFKSLDEVNRNKGLYGDTTVNHFYEKLFLLKNLMFTKTGKRLAQKRHVFMEKFMKEFLSETK